MKRKIGVFDSGIGGKTTLTEIMKLLPHENFIYYADSKNNPYGEKTDNELFDIVCNIVDYFISIDVKMIVIACNTATTRCIKFLREKYKDMLFVGTEPAVKVACDNNYNNTLVMATPLTVHSDRLNDLIEDNIKNNENIILISCDGLANAIENNNEEKINFILHSLLDKYIDKNIDAVVLGCTHYPLVKDRIQDILKDSVLIDGNIGVAKRVKQLLTENNLLNDSNEDGSVEFITSKKE
ncbi:MAG: glutamate racemase [Bacilli bacterium]|nr:glutamate racemase [Bacilli bacterium]